MRLCIRCKALKPECDFYKRSASKDGLDCYCKECSREKQNKYNKEHPEKLRAILEKYKSKPSSIEKKLRRDREKREAGRTFISEYKLKMGCCDCGYKEHAEALDFDHVRGKKYKSVGLMANRSIKAIMREIEKCEIRCANCHRVKTKQRNVKKD